MNKETLSIIKSLETTLSGQPWFGRSVYAIVEEVDESKANIKPNENAHSLTELLWHLNTWTEFALGALENRSVDEMKTVEAKDWREIDTEVHTWKKGMEELKAMNQKIIDLLKKKNDDSYLNEIVPARKYNLRILLKGHVQHTIYHLGQIAYVKKMLG